MRSARVMAMLSAMAVLQPCAARAEAPESAPPAHVQRAEIHAELAFDAYERKEFERALALYEMALAAADSPDILFNIARVYDRGLGDRAHALEYYRRYLAHPGLTPPLAEIAERRLLELQGQQSAAVVAEPVAVEAAIATPRVPAASDVPDRMPPGTWTQREIVTAALAGAGAIGIGVGVGFGLSAYASRDQWQRDCVGNACTSQHAVDAARASARKADVATIAFASGGVLLAVAGVFWWTRSERGEVRVGTSCQLAPGTTGAASVGCNVAGQF